MVPTGEGDGHLQGVEGGPGVAVGPPHQVVEGVVVGLGLLVPEAAGQQGAHGVGRQRLEAEQAGPGQQGGVDLEVRVLGGGPDQDQHPLLDRREQGVLLGAVEAVDLVDEQDGALAVLAQAGAGPVDRLPDVFHAGGHGREGLERLGRGAGHEAGQGGLARPRRPPQDDRRQPVGLDERSQRPPRAEEMVLAHHLVEHPGPHPGGERGLGRQPLLQRGPEQVLTAGRGHRGGPYRPGLPRRRRAEAAEQVLAPADEAEGTGHGQ